MTRRAVLGAFTALAALAGRTRPGGAGEGPLRIGGTGQALGGIKLVGDSFADAGLGHAPMVLPSLGSGGGIKALLAGKIDLAVSARALTLEEIAAGAQGRIYARTPVVLATNHGGAPADIDPELLRAMVSGQVPTWPDGTPVRMVLRPPSEADMASLATFAPGMAAAITAARQRPGMVVADNDQEAADFLEKLPGSFGVSTLALILAEGRRLRPLALAGVAPLADGFPNPGYPHLRSLLIAQTVTTSPAALQFLDFMTGAAGQQALRGSGHLPPA